MGRRPVRDYAYFDKGRCLTVALILGTSVPKGSKLAITAEMNVIAQKKLKRLPLKFQDEIFFWMDVSPEVDRKLQQIGMLIIIF